MTLDNFSEAGSEDEANDEAFALFVEQQYPILLRFLRKRVASAEDVEDIAQESMARLLRYKGQPSEVLGSLLYRIAANSLIDFFRRDSAKVDEESIGADFLMESIPSKSNSPEEEFQNRQAMILIRRAVFSLPAHCRDIYMLNRTADMTYGDIAIKYGLSIKAIEKQMSKALRLINDYLNEHSVDRGGVHERK